MSMLYDAEEIERMRERAAIARGRAIGEAIGEERGEARNTLKVLRSMISKNMSPEDAMDLIDIPQEERPALMEKLMN